MFKKKIGRPTNKSIKRRKTIKAIGVFSIIGLFGFVMFNLNNYVNSDNLKADTVSVPAGSKIKNPYFYRCLVDKYNAQVDDKKINYKHKFTQAELLKIKWVDTCSYSTEITNIDGIEYLKNLESFDFDKSLSFRDSVINLRSNKKLKSVRIRSSKKLSLSKVKLPFSEYVYKNDGNYLTIYKYSPVKEYTYSIQPSNRINVYNEILGLKTSIKDSKYTSLENVGVYKLDVTPESGYYWNDNTTGTKTITFRILPYDISNVSTKTTIPAVTYTGAQQKPGVKLYVYDKLSKEYTYMIPGEDYVVKYENNVNVGTKAKAIITGKGNYKGTLTRYFTIQKRSTANKDSSASISANNRLFKSVCGTDAVKFVVKGNVRNPFYLRDLSGNMIGELKTYSKCTNDMCIGYIDKTHQNFYIVTYEKGSANKEHVFGPYSTCVNTASQSTNKNQATGSSNNQTNTTNNQNNKVTASMSSKKNANGCYNSGLKVQITAPSNIKSIDVSTDANNWRASNKCAKNNNRAICTVSSKYDKLYYRVTTIDNKSQVLGPYCIK